MVRQKYRYMFVQYTCTSEGMYETLKESNVMGGLRSSIAANYGDAGASSTYHRLSMVYFNATTHHFVVRAPRAFSQEVWASLALSPQSMGMAGRVTFQVLHCSASVRQLYRRCIGLSRRAPLVVPRGVGKSTVAVSAGK
ncbi:ribonuclease P/MRP protein subunit Pop5 [Kipferlia bialata]|uniref:Ribonuclease P/MRP protein subunit POP5 n=1 Tax=Kipferlia bialata TaxID=797122 RepID=A0A9K3GQ22_9EUKA|nr:ribonuclease P/MRP protein subunit Pop5 [Kipferlia bialata]|eukprot:g14055.t1